MRLKYREDPVEISAFRCAQRRANLRRMVRIVVNDGDAVARLDLKSTIDTMKTFQSGGDHMRFDAHVTGGRKSSSSIQNIVHARYFEPEFLGAAPVET